MEESEYSNFDYAHDEQPDAEFKKEPLPPASEYESGEEERRDTAENQEQCHTGQQLWLERYL